MAQCDDFIERQYGWWSEENVLYGQAENYQGVLVNLEMNIFKPVGDGNPQRPLLVMVHGGGFHEGHRNAMNELCQWYAERGYVAATISYRLGLHHILDPIFAVDFHEMVRALYRGMQDTRGAIRFLKERAATDSTDINRVAVLGASAGGFIALHTTYMDDPGEKPLSCGALAPVLFSPRPDMGPIEGTMNLNGFDTEITAVVNLFGGLRDTSLIQSAEDPPLYAYHQTQDAVVHCQKAKPYWGLFPDTNNPVMDGSCVIQSRTDVLGFAAENAVYHLHEGSAHEIHDVDLIDTEVAEFLNAHICELITSTERENAQCRVFPNPSRGAISIETTSTVEAIEAFNSSGQLIRIDYYLDHGIVRLNGLQPGLVLLRIRTVDRVFTHKVLID